MVGSRIGERLQPTAIKFKQDKLRKWNLEKSLKMYTFANKRYPQDDNIRMIFHFLDTDIQPPLRFNNPFYYEPHPLCVLAAKELQQHLSSLKLNEGKMFGVLVVQTQKGILGYIAAYSGQLILKEQKEDNLGNQRKSRFSFVPAVFDYLQPDGYFKVHEAEITSINEEISKQTSSPEYKRILEYYHTLQNEAEATIQRKQDEMRTAKQLRDKRREEGSASQEELQEMIRESQFLKAEVHRTKTHFAILLEEQKNKKDIHEAEIKRLKLERKVKSDALQNWLFEQFDMRNAQGENKNLLNIWAGLASNGKTGHIQMDIIPPAGSGECCEPKLLQYAFLHQMKPLCMALFWWGPSPKTEIRHHLHYYPACNGKCKPILRWMLQGMEVDDNPLEADSHQHLKTVYEDDAIIVINKPAGMLSVPGKSNRESVLSILKEKRSDATGPMIVHRLDMATSGLLVVAKDLESYIHLQKQFAEHLIRKRYTAILSNTSDIKKLEGEIRLPLAPDINDRPRQKVDFLHGKEAITEYKILEDAHGERSVILYPHTGRTHQLRVHCAHPDGLGCPIKGDEIYGTRADRLYLHAEYLEFTHPKTGERIHFEQKAEW